MADTNTQTAITAEERKALVAACEHCLKAKKEGGANRSVAIHAFTAKALGLPVPPGVDASGRKLKPDASGTMRDVTPLVNVTLADLAKAVGVTV